MFNWILDEAATAQGGSFASMGITIVALIAVFYFMMYRPQKKQEKETRNLLDSLQVGDEITTHSGIIGKIVSMKDETVTIETSKDKTKIRFLKTAIARVDVRAEDC
ncbi:MAG: preprotein translocase subunit YajC [Clostridia bacterium]|nr:preprotein translocase subunit YajC [Clostridia bacterium]